MKEVGWRTRNERSHLPWLVSSGTIRWLPHSSITYSTFDSAPQASAMRSANTKIPPELHVARRELVFTQQQAMIWVMNFCCIEEGKTRSLG